ncbi:hypothetical protein O972_18235 [Mycobacterium avium subsp. avium 10-9275]|nr:hypothetical protein O972_18235 [Mycobacterium avium subsp. avium 10-9275]
MDECSGTGTLLEKIIEFDYRLARLGQVWMHDIA